MPGHTHLTGTPLELIAEFLHQEQVFGFSILKEATYGVIAGVFLLSLLSRRRTPEETEQ
jgi:hypothetical protein